MRRAAPQHNTSGSRQGAAKVPESRTPRGSPGPNTRRRWIIPAVVVVALGAAILAPRDPDPGAPPDRTNNEADAGQGVAHARRPAAVPVNRGADVPDGFRGDVHPLLHGRTQLELAAYWTALEKNQLKLEAPEEVRAWYTGLR